MNKEKTQSSTTTSQHPSHPRSENVFPDALKNIVKLKAYAQKYNHNFKTPYFVIMGTQSSGKTTFVSYLLQLSVGFTYLSIGNKCPVIYTLHHSAKIQHPKVKIKTTESEWKEIGPFDLPGSVEQHMKSLKNIVNDPLYVNITSSSVLDLVFVDLPGFQFQNQELTEDIVKVAGEFLLQPHTFILGMTKATEALETNAELKYLKGICEKYGVDMRERVLILVNKVDQQTTTWRGMRDRAQLRKLFFPGFAFPHFYITLNPEGKELDEMEAKEKQEYFSKLDEMEENFFGQFLEHVVDSEEETKDHFLLKNARACMERKLSEFFFRGLGPIIEKLEDTKKRLTSRINMIERELEECTNGSSPEEIMDKKLRKSVKDFLEQIIGLVEVRSVIDKNHANITSYDQQVHHKYDPERYGKSAFEEMAIGDRFKWDFVLPKDELISRLSKRPNQFLLSQLEEKQIGRATFIRLKKLLELFILEKNFTHYTNSAIYQIATAGNYRKFDVDRAVMEMVKGQLHAATKGIMWFSHILEKLMDDYCTFVLKYIESPTEVSPTMKKLYGHTSRFFMLYVKKRLNRVNKRWKETMNLYTGKAFGYDISVQSILYILNTPMSDIITTWVLRKEPNSTKLLEPQKSASRPQQNSQPKKKEKKKRNLSQQSQKNTAQTPTQSRTNTANLEKRAQQKIEALKEIRETLRKHSNLFTSSDIVEGGFTLIYAGDASYMNYDYLRGVAVEYYLLVLMRFLYDFDVAYVFHFQNALASDKMLEINSQLILEFQKEGKILNSLTDKLSGEIKKLRYELEKAKEELTEVDGFLHELAMKQPYSSSEKPQRDGVETENEDIPFSTFEGIMAPVYSDEDIFATDFEEVMSEEEEEKTDIWYSGDEEENAEHLNPPLVVPQVKSPPKEKGDSVAELVSAPKDENKGEANGAGENKRKFLNIF